MPELDPPVTVASLGGAEALRVGDVIRASGCPAWMVARVDHRARVVALVRPVCDFMHRVFYDFAGLAHLLVLYRLDPPTVPRTVPSGLDSAAAVSADSPRSGASASGGSEGAPGGGVGSCCGASGSAHRAPTPEGWAIPIDEPVPAADLRASTAAECAYDSPSYDTRDPTVDAGNAGELDPADEQTPPAGSPYCAQTCGRAAPGGWICTRHAGHAGDHVACGGSGHHQLWRWSDQAEPDAADGDVEAAESTGRDRSGSACASGDSASGGDPRSQAVSDGTEPESSGGTCAAQPRKYSIPDSKGPAGNHPEPPESSEPGHGLRLYRVQDGDRPMHVVAATFDAAIERWRDLLSAENPDDDCSDDQPWGVELVADVDELLLPPEPVVIDALLGDIRRLQVELEKQRIESEGHARASDRHAIRCRQLEAHVQHEIAARREAERALGRFIDRAAEDLAMRRTLATYFNVRRVRLTCDQPPLLREGQECDALIRDDGAARVILEGTDQTHVLVLPGQYVEAGS